MQQLNLPPFDARTIVRGGQTYILDTLRQRYVRLTPEEWVRQNFVHFLTERRGYPAALMANEVSIRVGTMARRCDSVVYHRSGGLPQVVIEYKAPGVAVTQKVCEQIYAYNYALHADYLFVSNGLCHYGCRMDYAALRADFLSEIPFYADLL